MRVVPRCEPGCEGNPDDDGQIRRRIQRRNAEELRLDPARSHQRADRWDEAADPRADVVALRLHSSFTRAVDVVHPLVGPLEQARDGGGGLLRRIASSSGRLAKRYRIEWRNGIVSGGARLPCIIDLVLIHC